MIYAVIDLLETKRMYTVVQKFGFFERSLLCSPSLRLFNKKSSNTVIYSYNSHLVI